MLSLLAAAPAAVQNNPSVTTIEIKAIAADSTESAVTYSPAFAAASRTNYEATIPAGSANIKFTVTFTPITTAVVQLLKLSDVSKKCNRNFAGLVQSIRSSGGSATHSASPQSGSMSTFIGVHYWKQVSGTYSRVEHCFEFTVAAPPTLSALTATSGASASGTFSALTLSPATFAAATESYTASVANSIRGRIPPVAARLWKRLLYPIRKPLSSNKL